jgi:hypothetical protein
LPHKKKEKKEHIFKLYSKQKSQIRRNKGQQRFAGPFVFGLVGYLTSVKLSDSKACHQKVSFISGKLLMKSELIF